MGKNPTFLTFYPNKKKFFLLLFVSFLFAVEGLLMTNTEEITDWFISFFLA